MNLKVIKRNGNITDFNGEKIRNAITKGFLDYGEITEEKKIFIEEVIKDIQTEAQKYTDGIEVEEIQDIIVAKMRKAGFRKVAKGYQEYREKRAKARDMNAILDILSNDETAEKTENANVNGYAFMGKMLHLGEEMCKQHAKNFLLRPEIREAHEEGFIYIHDLGWYSIGLSNCLNHDLAKELKDGFYAGHGFLRAPSNIQSAMMLAAIVVQSAQNNFFGGQSLANVDYAFAPYVLKSYKKHLKRLFAYEDAKEHVSANKDILNKIDALTSIEDKIPGLEYLCQAAYLNTKTDTFQAAEGFVHNMSNLESRAGSQQPFSSITYGMNTSAEGRMVIEALLNAQLAGLGHHETAIFPIAIFLVKDGVNFKNGDPNYDLYRQAMYCSAKRLFPTYVMLDAPHNLQYYKEGDPYSYTQAMGCRTRVMSNVNGREGNLARGNIAFVTIILPQLALEAKGNVDKFFKLLDKYIEMSKESLLDRYKYIISMPKECAPFIYKNDIMYSNGAKETIEDYMKQGSLSIGYLGLHECLMALLGKHHGESDEAQELGLKIVGRIRELTDKYTKNYHLNFSTFATPAENLSNTALKRTRARYGVIKDVTDKEYFTNSNHVDVAYHTSYRHKIEVEAPYHQLTNAGNITYIEMDSDISNNIDAFEKILATMKEYGVGYCGINIPVDECPVCYYSGNIGDTCPVCGYNENKEYDKDFIKKLDDKKITMDTKIREKLMEG